MGVFFVSGANLELRDLASFLVFQMSLRSPFVTPSRRVSVQISEREFPCTGITPDI